MTLRLKFLLFTGVLHALLLALTWELRLRHPGWFVALEALLLLSVAFSWHLYRSFLRPFQLIAAGTEAIKAKDFSTKFVPVGQREMDQLIGVYNHMLDALRQERVTQQEKSVLLERVLQASPAGILLLDFDGRIQTVNPAAEQLLQLPAAHLLGQAPAALPGAWGTALAALPVGQTRVVQLSGLQTYRAHTSQFIDRGFARHFIVLEEFTQEIIRQEKQAYEKLIRMMSHEVNNTIGAVNSLLQSFHYYAPQLTPEDQADFREALDVSVNRSTHLANFIANFAHLVRLPPPQRRPTEVHALLKDTCRLLQVQSEKRRIRWHWHLAPEPLFVELDAQQLEQALLNICKNALEAIGEDGNVWVSTTTEPRTLVIENDGPGIPPEVQPHLFTPFYSTKRDGQGIGLTLIRDILLQHNFVFSLRPQPNGRTAFTIQF